MRQGKERFELARNSLISNFYEPLWFAYPEMIKLEHLFEKFGYYRRAIIDDCHYSPAFNDFLAKEISTIVAQNIKFEYEQKRVAPIGKKRELSENQKLN